MNNSPRELPPGVHVILGDSAAGTFRQAFKIRDGLFVDRDVLSVGPTPPRTDLRAWQTLRRKFGFGDDADDILTPAQHADDILNNVPQLCAAEQVNLWFGTSMSEQFSVASTLDLLATHDTSLERVRLLPFEMLSSGWPAKGMGVVNPEQMREFPDPVSPSQETLDDYRAAWAVLTSPDPSSIERFPSDRPNANAWLKRAVELLKRRYPSKHTGLPHFDLRLLDAARRFPKAARIIGEVLSEQWDDGDLIGDSWLFDRLYLMADSPRPLLTLSPHDGTMRETQVALTPFGLDVLEGRTSSHPTNPIEDWAGGVRLSSSDGVLWFNDNGTLLKD